MLLSRAPRIISYALWSAAWFRLICPFAIPVHFGIRAPIPADMRETIFEPGVSTKGEGRGMGLSIVRQTLAEFGGSIALAQGEETAFVVTVPHKSANGGEAS